MHDLSGSQVFDQMRDAATAARREADAAAAAARVVHDRLDALGQQRLATLQQLATTQLPELNVATAGGTMPELVAEMQQFEQRRQQRAAELAAALAGHERTMAVRSAELASHTADLDCVVARRDALLADIQRRLAADGDYTALSAQTTQVEVKLARDAERANELRAEAKAKLPPYEKSALFRYLWRRGFGTPEYVWTGFTARMDRRLAEFVGYGRAVASYRFLKTTPELVRLAVERRTAEVEALRERLQAREDAVEAEFGLPAVQEDVDRRVAERERLVAAIEALQREITGVHQAIRDEVGSRGTFHDQALRRLTEFLARAETGVLERHARSTPGPEDDRLVAALRDGGAELARLGAEVGPLDREAHRRDAIADGLEDLLVRFRRAEYDAGRSEFEALDLDRLLADARTGGLPAEDLWRALRSCQRFRPPPLARHADRSDKVLSGVGLALQVASVLANVAISSSRRSSGGGFSIGGGFGSRSSSSSGMRIGGGGGFSTGRTIGGGGFSTGKRF